MRRTKRFSVIGAAALAFGLIGAGSALADGVSENDSDTQLSVYPNWLDSETASPATLFVGVDTVDADGDGTVGNIHDQETEKVNMHFDNSITFATSKAKRCANDAGPPVTTLAGTSTDVALDRCGPAAIGAGNAEVRIPTSPTTSAEVDLTVTTFLGDPTVAGGGFDGGGDEILLHAFVNLGGPALPTVLVNTELTTSELGGDFGRELNVPDAPDAGGSIPGDGALTFFNSMLNKTTKYKKGKKKKTQHLVTVKCDDPDKFLNISTRFEYDDASTETKAAGQNCGEK